MYVGVGYMRCIAMIKSKVCVEGQVGRMKANIQEGRKGECEGKREENGSSTQGSNTKSGVCVGPLPLPPHLTDAAAVLLIISTYKIA